MQQSENWFRQVDAQGIERFQRLESMLVMIQQREGWVRQDTCDDAAARRLDQASVQPKQRRSLSRYRRWSNKLPTTVPLLDGERQVWLMIHSLNRESLPLVDTGT